MRLAALALAAAISAAPSSARAIEPQPLRYDLSVDVPLALGTIALWGGTELLKRELAPARCRVCGTNALDAGARELLLVRDVNVPRRASDVLTFAVIPAGVAAHQLLAARAAGSTREGARDLLFVAEAAGIAGSLNQIVKLAVGRQRPFVHYGNVPGPGRAPTRTTTSRSTRATPPSRSRSPPRPGQSPRSAATRARPGCGGSG